MDHDQLPVFGDAHIDLDHIGASSNPRLDRIERVFGSKSCRTTVANYKHGAYYTIIHPMAR
jgi:hypothetical protein